jgi:signal transduction histidine kinase
MGEIVFTPEDRQNEQEEKEIETALRQGCASDRRWHMRKNGTRIWVDGMMRRLDDEKTGALRGFAKIARDATQQHEAQEQLQRAHNELERRVQERTAEVERTNAKLRQALKQRQTLEKQILSITEQERARISQDLHDGLCQELTGTAFLLKSRARSVEGQSRVAADSLVEAADTVNANALMARELARELHPIEIAPSGLPSALRELCLRMSGNVSCRCDCPALCELIKTWRLIYTA